jgi:hypothetical protein
LNNNNILINDSRFKENVAFSNTNSNITIINSNFNSITFVNSISNLTIKNNLIFSISSSVTPLIEKIIFEDYDNKLLTEEMKEKIKETQLLSKNESVVMNIFDKLINN